MANENVIARKSVKLTLRDGKEYEIKPLPIDDLIEIWPIIVKLEEKQKDIDISLLEDIKKLAYVAIKGQNNVKESDVGKLVDLVDLQEIIKVLVGQKNTSVIK